jgi:adenylosuccinate lyase
MATENIMMEAVKKGGDRQELHERIRVHSMEAGKMVKVEGKSNDLLERIAKDPMFGLSIEELKSIMDARNFVGRSPRQVEEFINENLKNVLNNNKDILGMHTELSV